MIRPLILMCAVIALVAGCGGEKDPADLTFAIFERAATERDRSPEDRSAGAMRTQEQTGELRRAGEFRGKTFYLGRDGDRESCVFTHDPQSGTGTSCGPGPLAFKAPASGLEPDEMVAVIAMPDGFKARVYEGRATGTKVLENAFAVSYRDAITVRAEGDGATEEIELLP